MGGRQEHTQERTRKCCTYPLVTYPLRSARKKHYIRLSLINKHWAQTLIVTVCTKCFEIVCANCALLWWVSFFLLFFFSVGFPLINAGWKSLRFPACINWNSFAKSCLPIIKKLPIPLPILYYFELIKVTVTDGPISVLPPPSQNCRKVTD